MSESTTVQIRQRGTLTLPAALAAKSAILVTHNTKHFKSSKQVRVVRPRTLITEARAWMAQFGR